MAGDAEGPNPWDVSPSTTNAAPGGSARGPIAGASADPTVISPTAGRGTTPQGFEIAGSLAPTVGRGDIGVRGDLAVSANVPDIANKLLPVESTARGFMNSPPVDLANPTDKQHALEITRRREPLSLKAIGTPPNNSPHQAELLVPDTAYGAGEDRPSIVLLDIQRAKRTGGDAARNGLAAVAAGADAVRAVAEIPAEANRYAVSNASISPATIRYKMCKRPP